MKAQHNGVDLKPLRDRNLKQNKNETKIFHYYYYYYYYYPSLCLSTDGRCFIKRIKKINSD